jgi:hypothetical protein
MMTGTKTTRRFLAVFGLCLAVGANASAQDVSPPPGFSPSAPPAARITGEPDSEDGTSPRPGFLKRLTNSFSPRQASNQEEDPFIKDIPNAPSGVSDPYSSPSPSYSNGRYMPPETHAVFPAPTISGPRLWLRAEALYWWTKDSPIPVPLVTTGSTGIIGQSDTNVIMGNEDLSFSGRGGARFTVGFALDQEALWALEGNFFFLSTARVQEGVTSDGSPGSAPLFLPYFNTATGREDATLIANPGFFSGTAVLTVQSYVQGAEANLMRVLANDGRWRWDGLAGFRYFNLHEKLTFETDSPDVGPPNGFFNTFDQFDVQNNFYGGQLGARCAYENPWIFINGTAKLAMGATVEYVTTNGGLFSSGGSAAGGYLTQPSNLGSMSRTQFAVIPGVDLNFGIRLAPWANLTVGYSFIYVSSVARPGDQIDHAINPSQSPLAFGPQPGSNSNSPALVVHSTDFWVQGLTFGLEMRY